MKCFILLTFFYCFKRLFWNRISFLLLKNPKKTHLHFSYYIYHKPIRNNLNKLQILYALLLPLYLQLFTCIEGFKSKNLIEKQYGQGRYARPNNPHSLWLHDLENIVTYLNPKILRLNFNNKKMSLQSYSFVALYRKFQ